MNLIHSCTLQKRYRKQKFTYSSSTGTPVVGQTITGQTSLKTAVIDKLGTGYLIVKTLSGTFTPGETIKVSTTFSATFGVATDFQNQSGEYEYYWLNDQTSVTCRFYYKTEGDGTTLHESGQMNTQTLKGAFLATATIAQFEYRIVTTATGFAGTYDITGLYPKSGVSGIDHYEAVLKEV